MTWDCKHNERAEAQLKVPVFHINARVRNLVNPDRQVANSVNISRV